jgi:hypothetical protein
MTNHRAATDLACDVCGRLPHPRKTRLTLAKLAAVLPVELAVHAAVLRSHLSYLLSVAVLTVTATVLVIWIVEPSAMRLLGRWLHAPALRDRHRLHSAERLWRVRTTVPDRPGALEHLTHELARLDANILSLDIHTLDDGILDDLVVATSADVGAADLVHAVEAAGGHQSQVWPTTALALADVPTKALTLALRVSADPSELALAAADLLGARVDTTRCRVDAAAADGTDLCLPSPWGGSILLHRPDEPFTPAESARAHRLAELAAVSATTDATLAERVRRRAAR